MVFYNGSEAEGREAYKLLLDVGEQLIFHVKINTELVLNSL